MRRPDLQHMLAEQRQSEVLNWADGVVDDLRDALDDVHTRHPEMTVDEIIMLIGHVAMEVLMEYQDEDFLRDVWDVAEPEISATITQTEKVITELEQLPLW